MKKGVIEIITTMKKVISQTIIETRIIVIVMSTELVHTDMMIRSEANNTIQSLTLMITVMMGTMSKFQIGMTYWETS